MPELIIISGLLIILTIGGLVSDYIFPHIKLLNNYINKLPMIAEKAEENALFRKDMHYD